MTIPLNSKLIFFIVFLLSNYSYGQYYGGSSYGYDKEEELMKMDVSELLTELNVYLQKYSIENFTATYDSTSNELVLKSENCTVRAEFVNDFFSSAVPSAAKYGGYHIRLYPDYYVNELMVREKCGRAPSWKESIDVKIYFKKGIKEKGLKWICDVIGQLKNNTYTYRKLTAPELAKKEREDAWKRRSDSISSFERIQAQNLIIETREFQDNIELAIIDGIDNDFNGIVGSQISTEKYHSTIKWNESIDTYVLKNSDGTKKLVVKYDGMFTRDESIEFFEFNPWREHRSNEISFVKRNYAYLSGGPSDMYDVTEKYYLLEYKEQYVFIKRVIDFYTDTEYLEINMGKSRGYYYDILVKAKKVNDDREYRNNFASNALTEYAELSRDNFSGWDTKYDQEISSNNEEFYVGVKENKKVVIIVMKSKYITDQNTFILHDGVVNGVTVIDDRPVIKLSGSSHEKYPFKDSEYSVQLLGVENDIPVYTQIYTLNQYKDHVYVRVKKGWGSRLLIFTGR